MSLFVGSIKNIPTMNTFFRRTNYWITDYIYKIIISDK